MALTARPPKDHSHQDNLGDGDDDNCDGRQHGFLSTPTLTDALGLSHFLFWAWVE